MTNMENVMQGWRARSLTICSVFPMQCTLDRDYGLTMEGGRTKFILKAAKKGSHSTLQIFDMFQRAQDIEQSAATGRHQNSAYPVKVETLANDMIQHWAVQRVGTNAGFRPGIMIIAGDEPTTEELDFLDAQQRGYFEGLYQEAKDYSAQDQHKKIGEFHRAAALWLGHNNEPWAANVGASKDWKECDKCYKHIDARATWCSECGQPQGAVDAAPSKPVTPVQASETLAQRAAKARQPELANA